MSPGYHTQHGRAFENLSMFFGMFLTGVLVLSAVAIWLGLIPHPGQPIPKWIVVLVVVPFLPKSAGRLTKGAVWKWLPGKEKP